ncbi:MAG: LysR family transcriptional regulator [Methylobacteriaceae bacterium]|uniref:Transcriptional regulator, LysR family n=5 Tax=Methylorubrum extorquens TaxID=408 RepID=C5AWF6_METEA|nr:MULTISPECIES: LysR family transcriptional regulator [Methylobacteriaceae]KQO88793.1 LysR family transcriptional regulator [Methylobacterium sp. Leaf92]KQO91148.1 LysR family transcriptional regulator [Methylobacterium sp. Leaf90]KQP89748.1 LysR family transcriptional regulator [Methylobacterium sp. Leaf119]KQQ06542.1 LysR family transcriptional regulator [Methylobacterium sp. Leaf121]MBA9070610.1 DNA-binding transcriptional LysR family regulator [Methylobacterium sp. RAS18]MCJ2030413.1 Lys
MDWDKIRIFLNVAEAGSFTRAGDDIGLSQSAVSRQISALERELKAPLFHRHARGLILTEQGDLLFRAARDMKLRLENTRARLVETSERPSGDLRVTTTVGLGTSWLSQRVSEFLDLYPDVRIELVLTNEELDLAMREADIAIRMRRPAQPDLIQRRLFTVHYHAFASPDYVKRFGEPKTISDLDEHRLVSFGGNEPSYLLATHYLASIGREGDERRPVHFTVNNITALHKAMEAGVGVGILPDYAVDGNESLVQVLRESEMPTMESYLVYAEEMRSVARVQAFRDFLVNKAQRWTY